MEVISYAKYLASPQYRKFPFQGLVGWIVGNFPPSVEDLQRKYNFTYYSTMGKAVTDVNNGTLANADANKNTAVAGVYTDKDGGKNVVLLKDTTEAARLKPSVDMTINLGGHKLSSTDVVGINIASVNVTIDGRLDGSTVEVNSASGKAAIPIQSVGANVIINGGNYIANADGAVSNAATVNVSGGRLAATNATILASDRTGGFRGISVANYAAVTLYRCTVWSIGNDGVAFGVYIGSDATATVSNCDIRAYSNYCVDEETASSYSAGIVNYGTATVNNSYVTGVDTGLGNNGTLYANGGLYEGYGHGGIYFSRPGTISYVRNATIRDCNLPDGYTDIGGGRNGAGFYIGGANDISVYMDNCNVYGNNKNQAFVLRGSSGEQNNSLYISNSTIPEGYKIRIDNDTHKLYIGKGNNFTAEDTSLPSAVVVTDEVYVREVMPNG